jgi:hypothetical protein
VEIDRQQLDSLSDEGKLIMMWTTEVMQKLIAMFGDLDARVAALEMETGVTLEGSTLSERVARLEQESGKL